MHKRSEALTENSSKTRLFTVAEDYVTDGTFIKPLKAVRLILFHTRVSARPPGKRNKDVFGVT